MRVPEDHRGKTCSRRIKVQILQPMQDVEVCSANLRYICLRQHSRPNRGINVAAHSRYWRDVLKLPENPRVANITCMDDRFDSLERGESFRAEQAMCVGDHADHRVLLSL